MKGLNPSSTRKNLCSLANVGKQAAPHRRLSQNIRSSVLTAFLHNSVPQAILSAQT